MSGQFNMTRFVKFDAQVAENDPHPSARWINPDRVSLVRPYTESYTTIDYDGGQITVILPVRTVLAMLQGEVVG